MNKKGLSDVVTSVLVILLVLAAVVIIAAYILGIVNKSGSEIGGSAACISLQLYPTTCTYVVNKDGSGNSLNYNLTVKATKQGQDSKVKQLDALLTNVTNANVVRMQNLVVPKFLETSAVYSELNADKKSSVSLVVTLVSDSATSTPFSCNPSKVIDCVEAS